MRDVIQSNLLLHQVLNLNLHKNIYIYLILYSFFFLQIAVMPRYSWNTAKVANSHKIKNNKPEAYMSQYNLSHDKKT
jgi:hypothetical protein